ncbi:hypothetical protein [Pseudosulfitobacter pseudonitzschiae]|uniref:hypothetical protein n=1 Tax=Pseudosulfitobacter pseudonitzschiae TaxID=1402135 RepID=UPI003B82A1F7
MEVLHFCKDGVLRRSFSGYDRATRKHHSYRVPLQIYIDCIDPDAFLKSLHSTIVFENGLTVGELMENLSPWADIMTGVGCLDFPAFLSEIRQTPPEITTSVDRIALAYNCSVTAVPRFDRNGIKDEKGIFNMGKPVVTDMIQIEEGWSMEAYLTEEAREEYEGSKTVSLSFTPMSEWKHLPIVIEPEANLYDETASRHSQNYLSAKKSLTNASHPLVEEVIGPNGNVFRHRLSLAPPSPRFFDALICGFFWDVGFHYSPVVRDEFAEDIRKSVRELDQKLDEGVEIPEEPEDHDLDDEQDLEFAVFTMQMEKIEKEAKRLNLSIRRPDPIH